MWNQVLFYLFLYFIVLCMKRINLFMYVAEIRILDKKQSAVNSLQPDNNQTKQALRRTALRTVSIGNVIRSVNPDRIRFFDRFFDKEVFSAGELKFYAGQSEMYAA